MLSPDAAGGEAAGFIAKWRGAWPEWALAEVFVPAPQRPLADAWQALQFEWQEAAWGGADPRPGEAKLSWWAEELDGWSKGRRRHPLGAQLQRHAAPWRDVAFALPTLLATRDRPASDDEAWLSVDAMSRAASQVDAALFPGNADAAAVAACWLHAKLARHADSACPLDIASSDPVAARMHAAQALLSRWPAVRGLTAPRGIALALARRRLANGAAAAPLSPWATLWAGWRGARG